MALVSLEDAKAHARIAHDYEDADILGKVDQAETIVLGYLEVDSDEWDASTVPQDVVAGILRMFTKLYASRGDDPSDSGFDGTNLPPDVRMCLWRRRPISMA